MVLHKNWGEGGFKVKQLILLLCIFNKTARSQDSIIRSLTDVHLEIQWGTVCLLIEMQITLRNYYIYIAL